MDDVERFALKSQLRWACRRGMLELDVILTRFLDNGYDDLNDEKKLLFQHLLSEDDPVLLTWLTGEIEPDTPEMQAIVNCVRRVK